MHRIGLSTLCRIIQGAAVEAEIRELSCELAVFSDRGGVVRDALWYCDLTTTPDGQETNVRDRISEIRDRYGPGIMMTQFVNTAEPILLGAVNRRLGRLAAVGIVN